MTHGEVTQLFLKWFQENYLEWYVFPNRTGYASTEKVHYGVPPGGGGSDFIAFGPPEKECLYVCSEVEPYGQTEFFEIKTIAYPNLSKLQKGFRDKMQAKGFKCWVFKELDIKPFFYVKPAHLYRPYKKWPY